MNTRFNYTENNYNYYILHWVRGHCLIIFGNKRFYSTPFAKEQANG